MPGVVARFGTFGKKFVGNKSETEVKVENLDCSNNRPGALVNICDGTCNCPGCAKRIAKLAGLNETGNGQSTPNEQAEQTTGSPSGPMVNNENQNTTGSTAGVGDVDVIDGRRPGLRERISNRVSQVGSAIRHIRGPSRSHSEDTIRDSPVVDQTKDASIPLPSVTYNPPVPTVNQNTIPGFSPMVNQNTPPSLSIAMPPSANQSDVPGEYTSTRPQVTQVITPAGTVIPTHVQHDPMVFITDATRPPAQADVSGVNDQSSIQSTPPEGTENLSYGQVIPWDYGNDGNYIKVRTRDPGPTDLVIAGVPPLPYQAAQGASDYFSHPTRQTVTESRPLSMASTTADRITQTTSNGYVTAPSSNGATVLDVRTAPSQC